MLKVRLPGCSADWMWGVREVRVEDTPGCWRADMKEEQILGKTRSLVGGLLDLNCLTGHPRGTGEEEVDEWVFIKQREILFLKYYGSGH